MSKDWFTAHRDGLRQVQERLVARRGFGLIGGELYQNVMDTDATVCDITIEKVQGKPRVTIECVDDGHGFHNLSDAWTMYAPSEKKGDPTKAGRFNIGEKVVLSFAHRAEIHTTSGTVIFNEEGRKDYPRRNREQGTRFWAELRCDADRYDQIIQFLHRIIVPPRLILLVNGEEVRHRSPMGVFQHQLLTEQGDDLRPTRRITDVKVYDLHEGESASLFELGIPVVETGDKWHVSIEQRVPLNSDRDNVTPSFLKAVRVAVFNEMHELVKEEEITDAWVNDAASDKRCDVAAATAFLKKKYGEKSVASDPLNPEADKHAVHMGFTLIPARGLTSGQRGNLKDAGVLVSSTKQFPGVGKRPDEPYADDIQPVTDETSGMQRIREYTIGVARRVLDLPVTVSFVNSRKWKASAGYSPHSVTFNVTYLYRRWFVGAVDVKHDRLIIHELAHHRGGGDHLANKFSDELERLGALLKKAALADVRWFKRFLPDTQ